MSLSLAQDLDLLALKPVPGQVVYITRPAVVNKEGEVCVPPLDALAATILAIDPDNEETFFVQLDPEVEILNQAGYRLLTEVIKKGDIKDYEFVL